MAAHVALYRYEAGSEERRADLLPAHRTWLQGLREQGLLHEAGIAPELGGALLVIEADSVEAARAEFDRDPFAMEQGLIASREISAWNVSWGVVAAARS